MARRIPPARLTVNGTATGPGTAAESPTVEARVALNLEEALAQALAFWSASDCYSEQTSIRTTETLRRFCRRLHTCGIRSVDAIRPVDVASFVHAATHHGAEPELSTRYARRTAVRAWMRALRALGHPVGDPTLDVALDSRPSAAARPLSDAEMLLGRTCTMVNAGSRTPLRAAAWALAEATAVTSEITTIRVQDIHPGTPSTVDLPGTSRHDPRRAPLTEWGSRVITDRIRELRHRARTSSHPDTAAGLLLAYGGVAPPGGAKAQASVCNAVRDVLATAGLTGPGASGDIRPASVRHWAGRSMYDRGMPLEQVAVALGCRSLDTAAEDIALAWQVTR